MWLCAASVTGKWISRDSKRFEKELQNDSEQFSSASSSFFGAPWSLDTHSVCVIAHIFILIFWWDYLRRHLGWWPMMIIISIIKAMEAEHVSRSSVCVPATTLSSLCLPICTHASGQVEICVEWFVEDREAFLSLWIKSKRKKSRRANVQHEKVRKRRFDLLCSLCRKWKRSWGLRFRNAAKRLWAPWTQFIKWNLCMW